MEPVSDLARTTPVIAPLLAASDILDDLRADRRSGAPLPALDGDTYARDHTAFEACSDQRQLIIDHLGRRLAARGEGPVSVLSVGCGDGTVDASLARGLLDDGGSGRRVRYVGVDPYASSTTAFAEALGSLDAPSLQVETSSTTWDDASLTGTFDVITFVHSMYYVPDVAEAVLRACDLLSPDGEVLVLSGPRGAMNALVDVCAPPLDGHRQWFSDDVAAGIAQAVAGTPYDADPVTTLEALLSLESATTDVLDFTVQARLTAAPRALVLAYLDAVSVPDPVTGEPRVPHPVDVHRVTRRQAA